MRIARHTLHVLAAALAALAACRTVPFRPPGVPLPDLLSRRQTKDRAALIVDVRDIYGDPAAEATVTLREVTSDPTWRDVPLLTADHFRYVEKLYSGTYEITVELPDHLPSRRRFTYNGAAVYAQMWLARPGDPGYYQGGERFPVVGALREIAISSRGRGDPRNAAAAVGLREVRDRPHGLPEEYVLVEARDEEHLTDAIRELHAIRHIEIWLRVASQPHFVALSNEVVIGPLPWPLRREVSSHLASLGFDTTTARSVDGGYARIRFGAGPDRRYLEAVDLLARGRWVSVVGQEPLSWAVFDGY